MRLPPAGGSTLGKADALQSARNYINSAVRGAHIATLRLDGAARLWTLHADRNPHLTPEWRLQMIRDAAETAEAAAYEASGARRDHQAALDAIVDVLLTRGAQ